MDARIWHVDKLVMTIKPSGPHNEVLISLAKQIKKERGRHVPKYDPLQIKKQKICRKFGITQPTLRIIIPCNNWYLIVNTLSSDTPYTRQNNNDHSNHPHSKIKSTRLKPYNILIRRVKKNYLIGT